MSDDDIFGGPPIDMSWADLGRINAEGYVDTQPVGEDPRIFEDQFERRSREKERTPSNLRPVTIVPNRAGPWTANNQLGIEQGFAPDINNQQTILKLDEWGFPEMWTVALGLQNDDSSAADYFEVTAVLRFGIGGVTQEVEVDWKQGTCISLPFNALNVVAKYTTPQVGRSITTIPAGLRLRASVARGAVPGAAPTRSFVFNNTASLSVPIPPFAKEVLVVPSDFNAQTSFAFYTQDWSVMMMGNTTTTGFAGAKYKISQCTSFIDFANQLIGGPMWLPVPPFARFCQVRNNAGGALISDEASFIFRLGF